MPARTQPNRVYSKNRIAFCVQWTNGGRSFPKAELPCTINQSPDVHELVKCRSTAEKHAVSTRTLTAEQTIVRNDDVFPIAQLWPICAPASEIFVADFVTTAPSAPRHAVSHDVSRSPETKSSSDRRRKRQILRGQREVMARCHKIGDKNFLMAGAHIGHNLRPIGNNVIIANNCLLGGHVPRGQRRVLAGGSTISPVHAHRATGDGQGSSAFGRICHRSSLRRTQFWFLE